MIGTGTRRATGHTGMAKKPATGGGNAAVSKVFDMIKEHSVEYVDFRFTDPRALG